MEPRRIGQAITAPVDVTLTGITTNKFQLRPSGSDVVELKVGASGAGASITADALEAVTWLTGRTAKSGAAITLGGDTDLAVAALAALRSD